VSVIEDVFLKIEDSGGVFPTQLSFESPFISLQRTFQCLCKDRRIEFGIEDTSLTKSNRLLDLLYGAGSTASFKCRDPNEEEMYRKAFESSKDSKISSGVVQWQRIVSTSINFDEVLVAFLFSPTCLSIFEMVMGDENITNDNDIAVSNAGNRKRIRRYLKHMLHKRYEFKVSSYPPLNSQQLILVEKINKLIADFL
jgi:hypothetical protein